jgi:hypothetical protein
MASNMRRGFAWILATGLIASSAAHAAPDPAKVLRIAIPQAETGFDPAQASEIYSSAIIAAIMEPLLTFDYLARPAKLAPLTAEALPDVAQNGKRFTFKLRKGTYFAADPAFKGKRRELVAADYVYAIKRLVDPRNRSPNAFYVAGKILGLDALVAAAKRNGDRLDYDAPVAGLETLDRYTLRITLTKSDYTFSQVMALPPLSAVAHEVADAYPGELAAHPVGTGPYLLKKWVPASKMILQANPGYRGSTWNFEPGDDPADRAIAARMRGKKVPLVGTIDVSVMERSRAGSLSSAASSISSICRPRSLQSDCRTASSRPTLRDRACICRDCCSLRSTTRRSTFAILSSADSAATSSRCAARSRWRTTSKPKSASFATVRRSRCRR